MAALGFRFVFIFWPVWQPLVFGLWAFSHHD
jgi:hypothetical protein